MTPAPLGKVVGWSAAPWPSLDELKTGMPDAPLPRKTVGSRAVIVTPADYDRARVCVEAMEGVPEPVEAIRKIRYTLEQITEKAEVEEDSGVIGDVVYRLRITGEILAKVRALLLTLTGGRQ